MTESTMLSATGLRKTYFTTQPPAHVLQGIDISVEQGEFVAIMGASGSGKSTLLYCLSGMDRPTGGQVRIAGRLITDLDDAEMAKVRLTQLGFVFQQPHFLKNLTLRDNVLLPALKARPNQRAEALARVEALLERFEIAHVATMGSRRFRAASCNGQRSAGRWSPSRR